MTTRVAEIEALLEGHTDRDDEKRILELLRDAPAAELSDALTTLDLPRLLGDVDDRWLGPDNATRLRRLLTAERLADLSIEARAALVSAFQRGRTDRADEDSIGAIFLGTRGTDLTRLKNRVDDGRDHRDLVQLVYGDIDDPSTRARILEHIAEQGRQKSGHLKILSDIDDTLYANWKDLRYPKKTVYPGVRQLYVELDRGPCGTGDLGDLVFVTARPSDRVGAVEGATHRSLAERGVEGATVLAGSFLHLLGNDAIAERKTENFLRYAAVFPEYDYVFVGDSGQGDAAFGATIRKAEPDRVRAVWIHDVVGTDAETRARWADEGVVFFDTYVGAATYAFRDGLIGAAALRRVLHQAFAELEALRLDEPLREPLLLCHARDRDAATAALAAVP